MVFAMRILCFEDAATAKLAPIVTGRPAYAINCASYHLLDWLQRLERVVLGSVRPHLHTIQSLDYGLSTANSELSGKPLLLVNARMVPSKANYQALKSLLDRPTGCRIEDSQGIVAAVLPEGWKPCDPEHEAPVGQVHFDETIMAAAAGQPLLDQSELSAKFSLFEWPHEVVAWHMKLMPENMEIRIAEDDYTQLQDGLFVADDAVLGEYAIIDSSDGPILLDRNVKVGPFCYLSGPVYAGPGTRIIEHSALKDGVALGHTVKIGGEVEASVIESYSNKQHHGFLGHSYLGSWINLGAGTCNSDLKNTYGKINIEYPGERVATDMQFMGCIMGDYAKTAINTGIFTGKIIGVGSMLYGFVTSHVPSFVNYARLFGQMAEIPPDVMINTQARMFSRRSVEQRDCDMQLIRDMFRLTAEEREQSDDLSLL
ncbi:Bifunctional protein GlmU [Roseimaritima multifibrata]|uniref:Bifunctional protein GlmU n=2 Tax=Roseimaritima multifibrata TaxID=1930274 RepID=A0A517MFJ9_9BACT|nr:Bifunctional protein GlmU [Roseimaritima multifibrata]